MEDKTREEPRGAEAPKNLTVLTSQRGFEYLDGGARVQMSSAVGDYDDSLSRPGSSYLWIGDDHVDREGVGSLIRSIESGDAGQLGPEYLPFLRRWLETGWLAPFEGEEVRHEG